MASDEAQDDERARRAAADLKETEDLLAGFDRPGRTPRVPPVKRDFVDFHLEKGRSNPAPRPPGLAAERARRDLPTAIIPAHKRTVPGWVSWAALLVAMSAGGILVAAALAGPPSTGSSGATNAGTPTSPAPNAEPALGSGRPVVNPTSGPERDIPPPPPPTPSVAEATATDSPATGSPATDSTKTVATAAANVASSVSVSPTTPTTTARRSGVATAAGAPTAEPPPPEPSPSPASPPAPPASASVDLIRNL